MAGGDRQGQQGRGASGASSDLTQTQRNQVEALRAQTGELAEALRGAQADHAAQTQRLAQALGDDEAVAQTYAERLGDVRGEQASAAADVALAIGELDVRHEVARAARRAGVRLRSAGAHASLTIAATSTAAAPTSAAPAELAAPPASQTPRKPVFDSAWATHTRDSGEVNLLVLWREGADADVLRAYLFLLDYWQAGVRDFEISDTLTRREIQTQLIEPLRGKDLPPPVKLGWAQARGLIAQALDVSAWRGAEPGGDFARYRAQVEERLLAEPTDDEQREALRGEEERFAREGDRPLCDFNLGPDETIANWLGAWSFGDYGLAYDLLTDDHPTRRSQSRVEYVAQRRQWADEAHPAALRLTLIREQEQRASVLWTPESAPGRLGAGVKRELEAFWSLTLADSPLGGQLDELPMGTLISKSSGRHWFWSGYSMQRDVATNLWLISRQRDEGAQAQGLPVEELTRRVEELRQRAQQKAQTAPQDPNSAQTAEILREVTGDLTAALHYGDALTAKLPLDESVSRAALNDARALSAHERAAAILERMVGRYGDDIEVRFELGVEQYLVAEQSTQLGQQEAAATWLGRATATLTGVADEAPTAQRLQGLGELLARQGHYNQAEQRLRQGIALDNTVAPLYIDLSEALMGQATDDNLDTPRPPTDEERQPIMRQALEALRDAARIDPTAPRLFTRMGAIYEALHQHEDAIIAFEDAIRREPDDDLARYTLGTLYLSRRDYEKARPLLEMASQLDPSSLQYRLALATDYVALERVREAAREIEILDKFAPGLPQVAELKAQLARLKKK
ncbi:MAG TPA: tetratricopeptide repeat protein [Ktedonobacterales bacterium]|jgi:tetratricopeptide (TPR) repeat protein|nr:tetratricopeptide repeat protein [Ktedonobacterales bacterium]